jgi:hypothetical protein
MPDDPIPSRIAPVEPRSRSGGREPGRCPERTVDPLLLFRTPPQRPPPGRCTPWFFLSRRFSLGKREREIVIARVTARCDCEYEWGVHATAFGAAAGLDDAALRATVRGSAADPAWSAADRLLVRLVDELRDTARVSDDLWRALAAEWPADAAGALAGRLVPRDRVRRERRASRASRGPGVSRRVRGDCARQDFAASIPG